MKEFLLNTISIVSEVHIYTIVFSTTEAKDCTAVETR